MGITADAVVTDLCLFHVISALFPAEYLLHERRVSLLVVPFTKTSECCHVSCDKVCDIVVPGRNASILRNFPKFWPQELKHHLPVVIRIPYMYVHINAEGIL